MDFFVGGMKRIQFKKKTVVGVGKHAPVIKATLPGVLLAEDLGDAREAISFFVRVLGCCLGGRHDTTPPTQILILATPYPRRPSRARYPPLIDHSDSIQRSNLNRRVTASGSKNKKKTVTPCCRPRHPNNKDHKDLGLPTPTPPKQPANQTNAEN